MSVPYASRNLSLSLFLLLTFGWAWVMWGYWVWAMPPGGFQITPAFIVTALIGGFAPSLAALIALWRSGGRAAVTRLMVQAVDFSFGRRMVLLILLIVPLSTLVSVALQAIFLGQLTWPDPALLAMALIWPLMAALGEEFGWRGVLLPEFESRFGLLPAAILIGLIWGVWHLPADYIGLKAYGDLFWLAFLINGPIVLTAHSIIMSWLWVRTGRKVSAALLYHFTITASSMLAPTVQGEGAAGLMPATIGAALLWGVAVFLILFHHEDLETK